MIKVNNKSPTMLCMSWIRYVISDVISDSFDTTWNGPFHGVCSFLDFPLGTTGQWSQTNSLTSKGLPCTFQSYSSFCCSKTQSNYVTPVDMQTQDFYGSLKTYSDVEVTSGFGDSYIMSTGIHACLPTADKIEYTQWYRVRACVVSYAYSSYMIFPLQWMVSNSSSQHRQDSLVTSFNEAVALKMIGCCPGFLDCEQLADVCNDSWLKISTLVRVELFWWRKSEKEFICQFPCHCCSFLVVNWVCFCPLFEVVGHHKYVTVSSFWFWKLKVPWYPLQQAGRGTLLWYLWVVLWK